MSPYPIALEMPLDIPTQDGHCFTARQEDVTRHHRILPMLYRRSDITASIEENVYPIWSKVLARAMRHRLSL